MAAKYDNVIVITFDCEDAFKVANSLSGKYSEKGKDFYHVVLTKNPKSEDLSKLIKRYPDFGNEIVDINTIQEADTAKLKRPIRERTKVVIYGHGDTDVDYIASKAGTVLTLCALTEFLKKNCVDATIQISLYSCYAGRGENSFAKALYHSLCEQDSLCGEKIKPTISASTSVVIVSSKGKKVISCIVEDDSLMLVKIQESTIQEQIAAISILPWVSTRRNLQILYDIEKSFLGRRFYKGLDSKVIFKDGGFSFPYAESKITILSYEDETMKGLGAYDRVRKDYRDRASEICLQCLEDIAAEQPQIQYYKEFDDLKNIICAHPYPYPALLSHLVDELKSETESMQLSTALDDFKHRINANKNLKRIQSEHIECAINTKYKFRDKEADKKQAIGSIITAATMLVYDVVVAVITAPLLPLRVFVLLCLAMSTVFVIALSHGLVMGYHYSQATQKRVMKCDDTTEYTPIAGWSRYSFYDGSAVCAHLSEIVPEEFSTSRQNRDYHY